jgi:hypothetical protein
VRVAGADGKGQLWDPLTGELKSDDSEIAVVQDPTQHPLKHLKGRSRQIVAAQRKEQQAARSGTGR